MKWDDAKGFGFIKTEQLKSNTFIHISTLKHMSRKPKVGDFIYFDIEKHDGKSRAANARIEGVTTSKPKRQQRSNNSGTGRILVIAVVCIVILGGVFHRTVNTSTSQSISSEYTNPNFKCDGRQYCSEMTSRAEAEFFIRHCPNTKMDGDRDGKPCENDSRF
ncbi:excalibur calcium-binding domain-containing protein [Pseudoalteromonas sp. SSDWG2]|uniref:excalibur calcium-binding domain-containing protein n=1 Tax=Pseudoalteromonas sp. SSDWG2 TaxID=3139391 RepID=UPI003BAADAB9